MNSIGNDVVDLNLAKTQSNWQRKGFLEKQFTAFEIEEILNSANPFLQVWLFWSMKEAAYKCYTQEFSKRFFNPKKLVCKKISDAQFTVTINTAIYNTNYLLSDSYIHTIAFDNDKSKMVSNLFFIDKNEYQNQNKYEQLLKNFDDDVELRKSEIGIPYLYQNEKKLPISISTSHHGDYGSYAFSYL